MTIPVSWGSYGIYSGPFTRGTVPFTATPDDDPGRKVIAIITATEGGRFGAQNWYDRCGVSMGLIQACAAVGLVTSLLGAIEQASPRPLAYAHDWMRSGGFRLGRTRQGGWVFQRMDGIAVPNADLPRLFLQCSGKTGDKVDGWTADKIVRAKEGVAVFAEALEHPDALAPQVSYVLQKLLGFVMKDSYGILFGDGLKDLGYTGALQALYLSFAANLPAVASKHFLRAYEAAGRPPVPTKEFVAAVAKQLTFGPQISIYPHRYNAIRPVIERLYGVDLPDLASDLVLLDPAQVTPTSPTLPSRPATLTPVQLQEKLIALGYDLGPAGADGKVGPKTIAAIKDFQKSKSLTADGIVGPKTTASLIDS